MGPAMIRHDSVTGEIEVVKDDTFLSNDSVEAEVDTDEKIGFFDLPAEIRTQ